MESIKAQTAQVDDHVAHGPVKGLHQKGPSSIGIAVIQLAGYGRDNTPVKFAGRTAQIQGSISSGTGLFRYRRPLPDHLRDTGECS